MKQEHTKSMADIKADLDFEEAKYRYEICRSASWRSRWWDLIVNIWQKSTEWAKKYILDPVNKIIAKVGEEIQNAIHPHYAYWISLINVKNEIVFEKVGTAEKPYKRWEDILKERYCKENGVFTYVARKLWVVPDRETALGLEARLKSDLIKLYKGHHVPNDRFNCPIDEADVFAIADAYLA
jgi:hypothetical protein